MGGGRVLVQVPATTANLGPGFDVLGMALNLYNDVEMEETAEGLQITVEGEGAETIPRDESNLVFQMAQAVFERVGRAPCGLRLHLRNRIPVTRGLGSSSAAVVGGLAAANRLLGDPLTLQELFELATEIEGHPDNVAPAIFGGVVVSGMARGQLRTVRIAPPSNLHAVVAVPSFELPTSVAREVVPQELSRADAIFTASHVGLMTAALLQGDLELFGAVLEDRMHQPYRERLIPGMRDVVAAAEEAGALGVVLSGAGPTMIAFVEGQKDAVGVAMHKTFAAHEVESRVMELAPVREGLRFLTEGECGNEELLERSAL
jgi:homoserine kinase